MTSFGHENRGRAKEEKSNCIFNGRAIREDGGDVINGFHGQGVLLSGAREKTGNGSASSSRFTRAQQMAALERLDSIYSHRRERTAKGKES